jgi:hypothetical protein
LRNCSPRSKTPVTRTKEFFETFSTLRFAEPMFRPPETPVLCADATATDVFGSGGFRHPLQFPRFRSRYSDACLQCSIGELWLRERCFDGDILHSEFPALVQLARHPGMQRGYFPSSSTLRLLVTENTPDTLLACISATCLSIWRATTPSRVTCPLFTTMWMGGTARREYWLRASFP